MSVLIDTSLGEIVIDLNYKECPKACFNFLKLCKIKYYNNSIFHEVQKDFIAIAGVPSVCNTTSNEDIIQSLINKDNSLKKQSLKQKDLENLTKSNSIYGILEGEDKRFFKDEINFKFKNNKKGVIAMANPGINLNTSLFYITLTDTHLSRLDGKHTIFGQVEEGIDVIDKINNSILNERNEPYQTIRIKHTIILDDPFDDSDNLKLLIPINSPEPIRELQYDKLDSEFDLNDYYKQIDTKDKFNKKLEEHEARNKEIALLIFDDIPDADAKPPENVLFICRLNPLTKEDELETIFKKYGQIKSCKIMKDKVTSESLGYGFIEYDNVKDCETAFYKMNGAIIDDKKIKVDFSQSITKNFKKLIGKPKEIKEDTSNILKIENKKLIIKDKDGLQNNYNKKYNYINEDYYRQRSRSPRNKNKY